MSRLKCALACPRCVFIYLVGFHSSLGGELINKEKDGQMDGSLYDIRDEIKKKCEDYNIGISSIDRSSRIPLKPVPTHLTSMIQPQTKMAVDC